MWQEVGGQDGGNLEDIEGTCPEKWMTGSVLMSWMMFFFAQRKLPWTFGADISIGSVSWRGGVKKGGTWRTMRVPDQRHGWQSHSWCHEWCSFTSRKITWKFCVDISIRSVSGRRVKKGVTWRMLRALDWRHGWQGHSWLVEWCSITLRNKTWKFQVNICICCEVIRDLGVNGQLP